MHFREPSLTVVLAREMPEVESVPRSDVAALNAMIHEFVNEIAERV